jgi:hypothetical protein
MEDTSKLKELAAPWLALLLLPNLRLTAGGLLLLI